MESATVFATLLNTAGFPVNGCQIGLPSGAPEGLSFSYQTTNPATNAFTSSANARATIADLFAFSANPTRSDIFADAGGGLRGSTSVAIGFL